MRRIQVLACAMLMTFAVLGIAPKTAFAAGETYTLSFTFEGKTEVYSTDYKLGTKIDIDDSDKFDDIINSFDEDYNWPHGITEVISNGEGHIQVSDYSSLLGEWDKLAVTGPCNGRIEVRVTWSPIADHPIKTWYLEIGVECAVNKTQLYFNANGGTGTMEKQYVTKGVATKIKPNEFTWEDHRFLHWSDYADDSGAWYSDEGDITISSPTMIFAQWESKHNVKVTDDGHGKASASVDKAYEKDEVELSVDSADEGYVFDDWEVVVGSATVTGDKFTMPGEDVEIKAKFQPISYTVAYDANGGDGQMANQDFTYDAEQALTTNAFKREGYTFEGWKGSDGKDYADGATVKNLTSTDGDTFTMTAQWKAIDYDVTVDVEGEGTASADRTIAHINDTVQLTADPKTPGYLFDGWEVVSGGATITDDKFTMPASDVKIKAKFVPLPYMVAFNANGGDGQMLEESFVYDEEKALPANEFTREGYTFACWQDADGNTYEDGATVKNLTDVADSTVTLSAQWTPNSYTVSYDANGGSGTMADQAFTYDTEQALTANAFTREGYTFAGWQGSDGNYYSDGETVKNLTATDGEVITMTAQWDAIMCTVTFNANGGSGQMDPQTMQYGVPTALNANRFSRDGYTFVCWNTKADGTGTRVADGINLKVTGDVTLYAQWKKDPVKKAEAKKVETTGTKKNAALPKTGDPAPVAATVAAALAGVAALAAGVRARRK